MCFERLFTIQLVYFCPINFIKTLLAMRKLLLITILAAVITGCNKSQAPSKDATTDSTTVSAPSDSTIYGVATDDFGMSSFAIMWGDSLIEVALTSSGGEEAVVCGSREPGDSFAITITDNGEALVRSINITQLKKHVNDYVIHNARLFMKGSRGELEPVDISELSDEGLSVVFPNGEKKEIK